MFLCSPRKFGEDEPILTILDSYFSRGLVQPPTSICIICAIFDQNLEDIYIHEYLFKISIAWPTTCYFGFGQTLFTGVVDVYVQYPSRLGQTVCRLWSAIIV